MTKMNNGYRILYKSINISVSPLRKLFLNALTIRPHIHITTMNIMIVIKILNRFGL